VRPAQANVRRLTCAGVPDREKQKRQKRQVGDTQNVWEQWLTGLIVLAGLVVLVWFPLILLATPGTTVLNPPRTVRISLGTQKRRRLGWVGLMPDRGGRGTARRTSGQQPKGVLHTDDDAITGAAAVG
jgi:Flp pilus assembly protein TadB